MTTSFVLRLASAPLAEGHVVGEVELVERGETAVIRSLEDLATFLFAGATPDRVESRDRCG